MNDRSVHRLLTDTRSALENPDNWGQRYLATDRFGHPVAVNDPTASRRCLLGGVTYCAIAGDYPDEAVYEAEQLLDQLICDAGLLTFNDTATHAEVMDILDQAIDVSKPAGTTNISC